MEGEEEKSGIDVESLEAVNALLLTFWWYIEDVGLRYDELTEREHAKMLNYFIKNHVHII